MYAIAGARRDSVQIFPASAAIVATPAVPTMRPLALRSGSFDVTSHRGVWWNTIISTRDVIGRPLRTCASSIWYWFARYGSNRSEYGRAMIWWRFDRAM